MNRCAFVIQKTKWNTIFISNSRVYFTSNSVLSFRNWKKITIRDYNCCFVSKARFSCLPGLPVGRSLCFLVRMVWINSCGQKKPSHLLKRCVACTAVQQQNMRLQRMDSAEFRSNLLKTYAGFYWTFFQTQLNLGHEQEKWIHITKRTLLSVLSVFSCLC